MEFYRIEYKGIGPYNNDYAPSLKNYLVTRYNWAWDDRTEGGLFRINYLKTRPTFYTDRKIQKFFKDNPTKNHKYYVYGFSSLDQFLAWFEPFGQLDFLKENKYKLYVYETDDYFTSTYQMIARKKTLKEVLVIDL